MAKFSETTRLLFLAAMAYVVALGWNTAVKKTFSIYIEKILKETFMEYCYSTLLDLCNYSNNHSCISYLVG